jgi:hypothetical protein
MSFLEEYRTIDLDRVFSYNDEHKNRLNDGTSSAPNLITRVKEENALMQRYYRHNCSIIQSRDS